MTVEKPKPKQLLRPITTGTKSSMNQSQFLAITCNSPEAWEISRVHGAIGFGFASHWLKNWRESFKPITMRSNRNHVITFDSHLKTALKQRNQTTNKFIHEINMINGELVALNCSTGWGLGNTHISAQCLGEQITRENTKRCDTGNSCFRCVKVYRYPARYCIAPPKTYFHGAVSRAFWRISSLITWQPCLEPDWL